MEPDVRHEFDRMQKSIDNITDPNGSLSKIWDELKRLGEHCENVCSKKYVTNDRFTPVRLLAFGFAALILTGFVGGLVALVFKSKVLP